MGRLEEQGHNGDSAETALLACNEKPEKVQCILCDMFHSLIIRNCSNFDVLAIFTMQAVEYLSKVAVYRGMGFAETNIHEAYSKSKGDWDKVLDVLVQGR